MCHKTCLLLKKIKKKMHVYLKGKQIMTTQKFYIVRFIYHRKQFVFNVNLIILKTLKFFTNMYTVQSHNNVDIDLI